MTNIISRDGLVNLDTNGGKLHTEISETFFQKYCNYNICSVGSESDRGRGKLSEFINAFGGRRSFGGNQSSSEAYS